MKITLSKSQWELIGNKTGWIKTAQATQELEAPATHHDSVLPKYDMVPKWIRNIVSELKTFATVLKVSYYKAFDNAYIEFTPTRYSMGSEELKKLHELCSKYHGMFSTINDRSVLFFKR